MTDSSADDGHGEPGPAPPDPAVAHPSRTYDYLLGGKDNLRADRVQVEENLRIMPEAQARVRAHRQFLTRAVEWLASTAGIRQFLDIGAGMPAEQNLHEVAERSTAGARYVYVDNNPVAVAHLAALPADRERTTAFRADLREPEAIVDRAAATLDFTEPVAVVLGGVLHFVPDADAPAALLARLRTALAPGSHVALTHISADLDPRVEEVAHLFRTAATRMVPRGHAAISTMLTGFTLVKPGLVPVHAWRPDAGVADEGVADEGDAYGGVGRRD